MAGTVLVVDDDGDMRVLARIVLEDSGYRVVDGATGLDGLERARCHNPDAIVLDLRIPDVDGWEFIARLRCSVELKHTPVIFVSADSSEGSRLHAQMLGCAGYVTKPYTERDLVDALARALAPPG